MHFERSSIGINMSSNRVQFINALRGISALLVMLSHICFMFWFDKTQIKNVFSYMQFDSFDPPDLFYSSIGSLLTFNFDIGAFGVASLFLISGFVIPLSMEKTPGIRFLVMRLLRIYPTYILGFAVTFLMIYAYTHWEKIPFPFYFSDYLYQISLLSDWWYLPSMDGISWSLQVELKFYLLIFLLGICRKINSLATLLFLSGLAVFYSFLSHQDYHIFVKVIHFSVILLIYMLIGVCFYNHYKSYWSTQKFVMGIVSLYGLFFYITWLNDIAFFYSHILPYSAAFFVFILLYYKRDVWLLKSAFLSFIADISYPLFIVHGLNSYLLMTIFSKYGISPYLSMSVVISLSILLSYIIYRYFEIPCHQGAIRFCQRFAFAKIPSSSSVFN